MPYGDGTGPQGMGPMTGRGMGYCAGYARPGAFQPGPGRGFYGRGGAGHGRGWRHRYYATGLPLWARYQAPDNPYPRSLSAQEEIEMLKAESENLRQTLENIDQRIQELSKAEKSKE